MSHFEIDLKFIRSLAEMLQQTGLNEIEYAEGDKRIRCVAAQPATIQVAAPMMAAPVAAAPLAQAPVAEAAAPKAIAGDMLTSPMVGTVYLSGEPGAAQFVKVGDQVKVGDTLLIIEAMKVMNPIKATKAGTISQIMVGDAQPVEFGEPLMAIA